MPKGLWLDHIDTISDKHQVCKKYLKKTCTKTTCPLAHPGVRDAAAVSYMRMPGSIRKVPFVSICPNWPGECSRGDLCDFYHTYIRPSTEDIIEKIYPRQDGVKTKSYMRGAHLKGVVKEGKFSGYGVFHWRNGASYIGDWLENRRHGKGANLPLLAVFMSVICYQ